MDLQDPIPEPNVDRPARRSYRRRAAGTTPARGRRIIRMKQYLLSIYQPDTGAPPPEVLDKVMREVNALIQETKDAGAWVFNGGLHPPGTATVVRVERGDVLMTDGPFAE